jgi:NADH-ubiquinone oxidoreductase chain 2
MLISIGFSLYYYVNDNKEYEELSDKNNSPIQLISQIKGFSYINPVLSLSFVITIFSFVGIPPLIGFFAKQMVLSAALDSGYVFLTLVAILTSVISAVYYLNIIKEIFFYEPINKINRAFINIDLHGNIIKNNNLIEKLTFKLNNITLSSSLTITISLLTLIILLFIFVPQE